MRFFKRAFSLINSTDSKDSGFVSKALSIIGKISILPTLLGIVPIVMIFVIFITVMGIFSYKLNLLQLVDPNGSESNEPVSYDFGILDYNENDFKECVAISGGAIYTSGYSDFAGRASSSTDSNFKDITSFNNYLKSRVSAVGRGTAAGVITAAMTLGCVYPKATGAKLFYVFPNNTRTGHDGVTPETNLDCRAFVQWAVYNGGFNADILDFGTHLNDWGESHKISSSSSIKPADIFGTYGTGHYGLIIGVYGDTCYTAEEAGYNTGLVILNRPCSGLLGSYNVYDMSSYYSDSSNVRA